MTQEQPRPADWAARERAVRDFGSSLLVEAGAGTGKTTVLLDRLLNLLREKGERLSNLVAITFTEKAAAELKVKLQNRLQKATSAGEPWAQQALADLETASITTIHSFCGTLLRERPVEAAVDPNFQVADELQTSFLIEEAFNRWLDRQLSGQIGPLRRAFAHGVEITTLLQTARHLCLFREFRAAIPPAPDCTDQVRGYLNQLRKEVERLEEQVRTQCLNREEDAAAATVGALALALKQAERLDGVELWDFLPHHLRFPKRCGTKENWKGDSLADVNRTFKSLGESLVPVVEAIGQSFCSELLTCLTGFLDEYEALKQERGLLDFHDLLLLARNMLRENPEVRSYFKERFARLLVDEFQDTDPLQAEVVFFLAERRDGGAGRWDEVEVEPGKLFLVGDPKQSIYRFRRADIELYAAAKKALGGASEVKLEQNFRSVPEVITLVNDCLREVIKRPSDGDYQPDYVDLIAWPSLADHKEGLLILEHADGPAQKGENLDLIRSREADLIAAFIRDTVARSQRLVREGETLRPAQFRDFCLLFRKTTALEEYEDALSAFDVPYRVAGSRRLYARQEIKSLVAVLRAVDNPEDGVAVMAALKSPFFGLSDEAIFLLLRRGGSLNYLRPLPREAAEFVEAYQLLADLHGQRNAVPAARLIRRLFEETRALELFALKPQGEQRVANLMKATDTARTFGAAGESFHGFVRRLQRMEQEDVAEEESPTTEPGDNFVQLMTVHKAKGLEFPIVILADAGSQESRGEDFFVDRVNSRLHFAARSVQVLGSDSKDAVKLATEGYAEARKAEEAREDAESFRLLYVALTRAKDWLIFPNVFGAKAAKGSLLKRLCDGLGLESLSAADCRFERITFSTEAVSRPDSRAFRVDLAGSGSDGPAVEAQVRAREDFKAELAGALERATRSKQVRTVTGSLVSMDEALPPREIEPAGRGADFGTLVHRLLARVDSANPEPVLASVSALAAGLSVGTEDLELAVSLVRRSCESDLAGRMRAARACYREMPLSFMKDGAIIEGVVDLVLDEPDGLVLVDYKTGADHAEYRQQLREYAAGLEASSGRPVKEALLYLLTKEEIVTVLLETPLHDRGTPRLCQ